MQPEEQQRIMGYFIEEAKDHLNTIEQGLLNLQATIEDADKANEIFRAAHSVKGGAAMLGLESIQKTAHRMEDYFKILKESPVQVDRVLETMFLRISDGLKDLLEQLEGPFGLTQDKAQEIMADVEPVFGQIETHLGTLVSAPIPSQPGHAKAMEASNRVSAHSLEAIKARFKRDGASFLRKMLAAFKQPDNAESRKSIQDICAQLHEMGGQFELSAWCDLIETARLSAASVNNDYRALAPVLIRDIKQAQDLVLAGRASEISVSEAMQSLLPEDIIEDAIADEASGIDSFDLESSLEDSLHGLDFASDEDLNGGDREENPDEDFSQLFGDREEDLDANFDSDTESHIGAGEEDLGDLFGDSGSNSPELDSPEPKSPESDSPELDSLEPDPSESESDIERLSLDLDFDEIPSELSTLDRSAESQEKADESLDALLATVNVTGPEVGQDELNSLADLFDGDLDELDNTLGGHAFATEEMQLHPEKIELSTKDDLRDLLSSDPATESSIGSYDDDLFGGTLTDGEFAIADDLDFDETEDPICDQPLTQSALSEDLADLSRDLWVEDDASEHIDVADAEDDSFDDGLEFDTADIDVEDADGGRDYRGLDLSESGSESSLSAGSLDNEELDSLFIEETPDTAIEGSREEISAERKKIVVPQIRPSHTVSPKEEEIEFPTLTGEKLQEAEEDIDSFFLDDDLEEADESVEQLADLPWGELSPETEVLEPKLAEFEAPEDSEVSENPDALAEDGLFDDAVSETFEEAGLLDRNLSEAEAQEDVLEEDALEEDLEAAFLESETPTIFNVDLDVEQAAAELDELLDTDAFDTRTAALPADQDTADDLWNDLLAEDAADSDTDLDLSELDVTESTLENTLADDALGAVSHLAAEEPSEPSGFDDSEPSLDLLDDLDSDIRMDSAQSQLGADSLEADLSLGDLSKTDEVEDTRLTEESISDFYLPEVELSESETSVESESGLSDDDFSTDDTESSLSLDFDEQQSMPASFDDLIEADIDDDLAIESSEPLSDSGYEQAVSSIPVQEDALELTEEITDEIELEEEMFSEGTASEDAFSGEMFSEEMFSEDISTEDISTEDIRRDVSGDELSDEVLADFETAFGTGIFDRSTEEETEDDDLEQIVQEGAGKPEVSALDISELEVDDLLNEGFEVELDGFLTDDELAEIDDSLPEIDDYSSVSSIDLTADFSAQDSAEKQALGTDDFDDSFDDLDALLSDEVDDRAAENADDLPTLAGDRASENAAIDDDGGEDFGDLERLLEDGPTESVATTSPQRRSAQPAARRTGIREQTMRVSVNHLDTLSNLVGELVVSRNTLERDQERLRQFLDNLLFQVQQLNDVGQRMRDLYERSLLESSLMSNRRVHNSARTLSPHADDPTSFFEDHATGETFDALEMDRFTGFHTLSQEMIELIVRVRESSSDIGYTVESSDQVTRQFRQITTQLQEGLNTARMVAFSQAADRLPRAVRDISLKCGKEARLLVEGQDTLIDKMIVEHLYDPLTHLVNNAITHGIETPKARKASGKLPEGTITVRAFYQGNQTVIYVADDGGGIDTAFVKRKALEKNLISQTEARELSDIETYDLLFHPGFSTRDQADDFAGRGVGMDVVRTSLAEIRGSITIDSELGKGTSFTIRLPLTLSISKALSCVSNQARIAFPMDGVEDMLDVPRDQIVKNDKNQDCVRWRDTLLSFQPVTDLLKFNRTLGRGRVYGGSQEDDVLSIIVLRSANTYIAVQVDQVIGEQEIVIKQLEGPVPKPLGIAGATVLGDGRVMPIADVIELIDIAMGRVRREPASMLWTQDDGAAVEDAPIKNDPTVLIVDDSITVRELLSMSFNKVGYRVEQARDGQEAWDKLRSGLPCDLVFCDIEMPRMDGLELLSRMQKDNHLKSIPIAMLTSRGADRHRQMAVDLGASGYFTKPYLEEALLDAAQRMLNGETLAKGRGG